MAWLRCAQCKTYMKKKYWLFYRFILFRIIDLLGAAAAVSYLELFLARYRASKYDDLGMKSQKWPSYHVIKKILKYIKN